jgi:hypothetical protein
MSGKFTTERRDEIRAKKNGWHVARSTFDNMNFYIDHANITRYIEITGARKIIKCVHSGWKKSLYCGFITKTYIPNRMNWKHIAQAAQAMNIPAELLIDEEYYYKKCGLAGYRILFELYRQNKSLDELLYHPHYTGTQYERHWFFVWSCIIHGTVSIKVNRMGPLSDIIKQTHKVLGMPMASLCGKLPHINGTDTSEYRTLRDDMEFMGQREVAFMAGVSKALAQCAYNKANIEPYMERLVEWYNGEEKDRSDGVDTRRGEQITFDF